jgi:hypothetical protein
MEIIRDEFSITVVVLMPESGKYTPFQGFDRELCYPENRVHLEFISYIPWSVREIFQQRTDVVKSRRVSGNNEVFLLSEKNILKNFAMLDKPFVCVLYNKCNESFIKKLKNKFQFKPILISDAKNSDIKINQINSPYALDSIIKKRYQEFCKSFMGLDSDTKGKIASLKVRLAEVDVLPMTSWSHNVTKNNELILRSIGYEHEKISFIRGSSGSRIYINAILDSSDNLLNMLGRHDEKANGELVLYATGMYSFLYDMDDPLWGDILRGLNENEMKFIINGVLKNENYSGINFNAGSIVNPLENEAVRAILLIRKIELNYTAAAIFLIAYSKLCPAIRLPNSLHFYSDKFSEIERLSISEEEKDKITQREKFKALHTIIKRRIGKATRDYVSLNSHELTFVSDFPLEWLRFGRIPLMFTHETSRINVTPGNMLLVNSSQNYKVSIKTNELKEVLIIRSFEPDDHLKFHLEMAIDTFPGLTSKMSIRFEDVRSKNEMVDVLNEFEGNLIIFDCHGNHGGNKENGWLIIGEDKVDTWTLKDYARVPPIVILSACSTSSICGSHASVSNGFLVSGALTVIGTLLPVNSISSAVFVARLLFRISDFLPALKHLGYQAITWRTFVSTFMRMSYVTDILRFLYNKNIVNQVQYEDIHIKVNIHINKLEQDWFDLMMSLLVATGNITEDEMYNFLDNDLFLTQTMYYSQIGRSENVVIDLVD